jgi:hypothetical protein
VRLSTRVKRVQVLCIVLSMWFLNFSLDYSQIMTLLVRFRAPARLQRHGTLRTCYPSLWSRWRTRTTSRKIWGDLWLAEANGSSFRTNHWCSVGSVLEFFEWSNRVDPNPTSIRYFRCWWRQVR